MTKFPSDKHEVPDGSRAEELLAAHQPIHTDFSGEVTRELHSFKEIMAAPPQVQIEVFRRVVRPVHACEKLISVDDRHKIGALIQLPLPFTDQDLASLGGGLWLNPGFHNFWDSFWTGRVSTAEMIVRIWEKYATQNPMAENLRSAIQAALETLHGEDDDRATRALGDRLAALARVNPPHQRFFHLYRGEAWSDRAIADISALDAERQTVWAELLELCGKAKAGKPTDAWLKRALAFINTLGWDEFSRSLAQWLPLVDKTRTHRRRVGQFGDPNDMIIEPHRHTLNGLCWIASTREDARLARELRNLAMSGFRKIPAVGPRCTKIGNAAVYALGQMPGLDALGQLGIVLTKVKVSVAKPHIRKAFEAAAARLNLRPDELEELATPDHGFTEGGVRRESFGGATAELRVVGSARVAIAWSDPKGKSLKSPPAHVRTHHAAELKELRVTAKDAQALLQSVRHRLESLFLQRRSWPVEAWKARYMDHPLVGAIASRLIWEITTDGPPRSFVIEQGRMIDAADRLIESVKDGTIRLWHPLQKAPEEVTAWRESLELRGIQQPFKQAHREVYLVTDTEREARTYSNRFAGHILNQHQFHSLCALRGWRSELHLVYEGTYDPAEKWLPECGLRAEFEFNGGAHLNVASTTQSGVLRFVTTGQIRFYRTNVPLGFAEPIPQAPPGERWAGREVLTPLENVPPLAFSEIMRDVDLFIGVASVGNDPAWADAGAPAEFLNHFIGDPDSQEARARRDLLEYWHRYAGGQLDETAKTRKAALERIIPRLRIAARCTFQERHLIVRGDLRTYKIHLGSGNILMSPGNQYLCIVGDMVADSKLDTEIFLPFEGDKTLSLILSKAFMLADDTAITDPAIVNQIQPVT